MLIKDLISNIVIIGNTRCITHGSVLKIDERLTINFPNIFKFLASF